MVVEMTDEVAMHERRSAALNNPPPPPPIGVRGTSILNL